jgi:hypothetical protein|tara:strand:- start:51 stop:497 length:447 start_codon:yes stop_codon:yes gene_type:complete
MFKKLILNEDLNDMLGDYIEIIENICYYGNDDDYFQDAKFNEINNFCDITNCDDIVNNYGVIKAIKLHNDHFGDIDFDESESKINKKLAFVIIYDFLHFVDLDFYNQYMMEDCDQLQYIDDNEDIINYIESGIKNFHYKSSNKFYPIF